MSRPAHIDKAVKELRSYARSEMAKSEIVQFRVDSADFERLVDAATAHKMPMGTLIRNWVLNCLEQEESDPTMFVAERTTSLHSKPKTSKPDDITLLKYELSELKKRLDKLES